MPLSGQQVRTMRATTAIPELLLTADRQSAAARAQAAILLLTSP